MIVLEVRDLMQVLRDMGYTTSPFIESFNKDIEFISLYLLAYGIKLETDIGFLNLYRLKFNDKRQEFMFRLTYSHIIYPQYQKE